MDKIYRNAEFTIVATGPSKRYGLPGVSTARKSQYQEIPLQHRTVAYTGPDPYEDLQKSTWMERAWTFQEGLLSRRLLVFTDYEMSFYCDTVSWTEFLGGLKHVENPRSDDWTRIAPVGEIDRNQSTVGLDKSNTGRHTEFLDLAKRYTSRNLGRGSDALNGFIGVVKYLSGIDPSIYHIAGLPYFPTSAIEIALKQKRLTHALCWDSTNAVIRRRSEFPSWSWTGWTGGALWVPYRDSKYTSFTSNMRLASKASPTTSVSTLSHVSHDFLDTVDTILFNAPLLPVEKIFSDRSSALREATSKPELGFPPPAWIHELYDNMTAGLWSLFLIGYVHYIWRHQILVVEWKDTTMAKRVGCFVDRRLKNVEVEELGRRDVRLVWLRHSN